MKISKIINSTNTKFQTPSISTVFVEAVTVITCISQAQQDLNFNLINELNTFVVSH